MFKALHKPGGEEIVILDPSWRRRLDTLRLFDARDELLCQGCLQPVRVRAGDVKRWHFAHKHLQNCPYEFESPALLQCRAVLYEWLVSLLGEDMVTLEKQATLPRPVDCWVSGPAGEVGYWIIENRMPPFERQALAAGMAAICPHPVWVFTTTMLHPDEDNFERLYLTTTEREFLRSTAYDSAVQNTAGQPGSSLHYLDSDQEMMITLRGLQVFHRPQLYSGYRYENPLSQVSWDPQDGGFVHPGEGEHLQRTRIAAQARIREQQKTEQRAKIKMTELLSDYHAPSDSNARPGLEPQAPLNNPGKAGLPKCIYCGRATDDYWYLNRADNTCKCRDCYRQGKY